jgi:hypothetical protein
MKANPTAQTPARMRRGERTLEIRRAEELVHPELEARWAMRREDRLRPVDGGTPTVASWAFTVRMLDLMPVASEEEKHAKLWPEQELLRVIEGVAGAVEVEVVCHPPAVWSGRAAAHGAWPGRLLLRGRRRRWCSRVRSRSCRGEPAGRAGSCMAAGRAAPIRLARLCTRRTVVLPTIDAEAERRLARTIRWW